MKFPEFIKTVSPDDYPEYKTIPKEAQVKKAIDRVLALIHKEAEALGGDYSRVFLGGWSQGAVLAVMAALDKDCPSLGGCFSLSGTFQPEGVEVACKEPLKSTPFLLTVALKDDLYPVMLLYPMVEKLRAVGFNIELREKNMDHCLNGSIGCQAGHYEERLLSQWIAGWYQNSSLGALFEKAPSSVELS